VPTPPTAWARVTADILFLCAMANVLAIDCRAALLVPLFFKKHIFVLTVFRHFKQTTFFLKSKPTKTVTPQQFFQTQN